MINRRMFNARLAGTAFAGLAACSGRATETLQASEAIGYGPLMADAGGLLDLPKGFSYSTISQFGERMDDGHRVPDRADGMGCFRLDKRRVALVRNHELSPKHLEHGPFGNAAMSDIAAFDRAASGEALPGGTTTIVYDVATRRVEAQHLSLTGTIRNCAGGTTPWGTWLTCEEDVTRAGSGVSKDHGWVFEVPTKLRGIANPLPLKAMGRFNHEAAAVDPRTGIVYLTEDREEGLFYRFLPNVRGALTKGGRLQALALDSDTANTRNKVTNAFPAQSWLRTRWIDLDDVEASGGDDLRKRGAAKGAAVFARGEGIHFGRDELYFACTSGGAKSLGQIMRYRPSGFEGQSLERREPGRLQNFLESTDAEIFNYGDNLTVAPNGHLIVCEDQYTSIVDNHLRGVTQTGAVYTLAKLRTQTETAGVCFSPDGSTMFLNVYEPAKTLAITGPWGAFGQA
jgi:uncharacterized protein